MSNFIDMTGKTFGLWSVIHRDDYRDGKHTRWVCKCKCGTVRSLTSDTLLSGRSTSCGCRKIIHKGINATHGMSKTRLYREWLSMKRRCLPDSSDAKNYYCRGITVCKEWLTDFLPFYEWSMSNGYDDSLSLDRINNNEGYSPDNCRWISLAKQQSNKTNNVHIQYQGRDYCLRALCIELGFPYKTAHKRLQRMKKKGDSINTDKLFAPIQKNKISFRFRQES